MAQCNLISWWSRATFISFRICFQLEDMCKLSLGQLLQHILIYDVCNSTSYYPECTTTLHWPERQTQNYCLQKTLPQLVKHSPGPRQSGWDGWSMWKRRWCGMWPTLLCITCVVHYHRESTTMSQPATSIIIIERWTKRTSEGAVSEAILYLHWKTMHAVSIALNGWEMQWTIWEWAWNVLSRWFPISIQMKNRTRA